MCLNNLASRPTDTSVGNPVAEPPAEEPDHGHDRVHNHNASHPRRPLPNLRRFRPNPRRFLPKKRRKRGGSSGRPGNGQNTTRRRISAAVYSSGSRRDSDAREPVLDSLGLREMVRERFEPGVVADDLVDDFGFFDETVEKCDTTGPPEVLFPVVDDAEER